MRLVALEQAAGSGAVPVEAIVRAYLEPVLEMFESGPGPQAFLRIHAQMKADPFDFSLDLRRQAFASTTAMYLRALSKTCTHLSASAISWRMHAMIGAYQLAVSQGGRIQDFLDEMGGDNNIHDAFDQLIAYSIAGFAAPDVAAKAKPKQKRKTRAA
jgi:hypothetical protein